MGKVVVKDVFTGRRGFLTDAEYNRQMEAWSREVQKLAKAGASAFTKGKHRPHTYHSGKKAGSTEYKLRNKVQCQLKSDAGEVAGVLFQFPVHGIFREYGVGRGAPRSLGNSVRRSMSDWFSGALNRKENKMLDIVAEHQADKVVRTFMGINKGS